MRRFAFLVFTCGRINAQPPSDEPIFGILFDSQKVHFEKAPASVVSQCERAKELKNKPFWMFAHAKVGETEYFILSNKITQDSGAGYVMRGKECVEWLPERLIYGEASISGTKDALPKWAPLNDDVVRALTQDVFRRYSQAWGSKKAFLDALKKGGLPPKELPKVVRDELAVFSREP